MLICRMGYKAGDSLGRAGLVGGRVEPVGVEVKVRGTLEPDKKYLLNFLLNY